MRLFFIFFELFSKGYEVIIVDDLSNSSIDVLKGITNIVKSDIIFEKIDLKNKISVKELFNKHKDANGIIHFAASKAIFLSVLSKETNNYDLRTRALTPNYSNIF